MRFMLMHKLTPALEAGTPPTPEEMEKIGALMGEAAAKNLMISGEGLHPSSTRTHLAYRQGKRTRTDGPFSDPRELIGGIAILRVQSREEAIGWCDRFAAVLGDVEMHLGPIVENWDLGFGEKPADAPLRFLATHRAADDDAPPSPEVLAKMGALMAEMTKAGVLQEAVGLAGTKHGARVHLEGGRRRVIDGPFTESKELISGYAILELPSKAEAIDWAIRFGEIVGVHEIDVRLVA